MAERRVKNREQNKSRPLPFRRMELIDLQRDGELEKLTESCGETRWKMTSDGCCKIHELFSPNEEGNVQVTSHQKHAADGNGNPSLINLLECTDVFVLCLSFTKPSASIRNEAPKPECCSWTLQTSETVLETTFGNINQIAWLHRV